MKRLLLPDDQEYVHIGEVSEDPKEAAGWMLRCAKRWRVIDRLDQEEKVTLCDDSAELVLGTWTVGELVGATL